MGFFRKTVPPPAPETLERKADSLRPGASPEPLEAEEVTGLIDLTLERLSHAQQATTDALERAAKRLEYDTRSAIDLARRLSSPPKK